MGTQRQAYLPFHCVFPRDFPERLLRFKEASGLSWRTMPVCWASASTGSGSGGTGAWDPSPAHLFLLLTIAVSMGLRDGILMCPDLDLPEGFDPESLPRRVA